ncbi:MAG: hypothetical protein IJ415_04495 [Clostridia bacterium]|nr:hypothetical protein [Clostridia bacterium]
MDFLKKWIGCILSFVAGVLGLAMSACTGMIISGSYTHPLAGVQNVNEVTKAFKVLTDSSLYSDAKAYGLGSEFMTMKVFAIITLVISILLIVYAIIMLLKNLNVIKSNSIVFDIIGWTLVALFLIATIGLLVSSNVYAGGVVDFQVSLLTKAGIPENLIDITGKVGLYQPFMLGTSIILAIVTAVFAVIKLKAA